MKDLPYTYKAPTSGTGSVFNDVPRLNYPLSPPILRVSGINRASIAGSFALAISQTDHTGKAQVKGIESVLSRWHVQGCANCQTHLSTTAFVPLFELNEDDAKRKHANNELAVHLHTRGNPGGQRVRNVTVGTMR